MLKVGNHSESRLYFRGKTVSPETVKDLYYKYLDNLGEYLLVTNPYTAFFRAEDIHCWGEWDMDNNPYCSGKDPSILGKDLEARGSYWPIIYEFQNGVLTCREGGHRILALREVGCARRILSLETRYGLYEKSPKRLNRPMNLWMLWPSKDIDKLVKMREKGFKIEKADEDLYRVTIVRSGEAQKYLVIYSMFLAEMIFKNYPYLKPSPIINNKEKFDFWYGRILRENNLI